jgi:stringent starvation protein B
MSKITKSLTPYHFYALYNWIIDNGFKPHVYIRNTQSTQFPPSLQAQQMVMFNIHPDAIGTLTVDDDGISFTARFNQKEFTVYSKLEDCLAIIAKEIDFAAQYPFIPILVNSDSNNVNITEPKDNVHVLDVSFNQPSVQESIKPPDTQIPGRKVRHLTVVK